MSKEKFEAVRCRAGRALRSDGTLFFYREMSSRAAMMAPPGLTSTSRESRST